MEKSSGLESFKKVFNVKGNRIYVTSLHHGYSEEEYSDGEIVEHEDGQTIYRLLEEYQGIGQDDKDHFIYHVLETIIGGTMEDEEHETIRKYEKYQTKEDALKYIETETQNYLKEDRFTIQVLDKVREDIKELLEKGAK